MREGAPYTEVRRLYTMSSRAAHTAGAAELDATIVDERYDDWLTAVQRVRTSV